jgi:amidophosphoribosyltransferase
LLAADLVVDEIRSYLKVDTLAYLALDRLVEATGAVGAGFCNACFTGEYPVEIAEGQSKHVLEAGDARPVGVDAPVLHTQDALLPADEAARRSS